MTADPVPGSADEVEVVGSEPGSGFRISDGLADVERFLIKDLRRDPKNPRVGDRAAVRRSIAKFGQVLPVLIAVDPDQSMWVVGGNTTMDAIVELGGDELAGVIAPRGLSETELRSLALALNRTSDLATYDSTIMAEHLLALHGEDIDLMHAAGFDDTALVDALIAAEAEGWDPPDEINVEGYTRRKSAPEVDEEGDEVREIPSMVKAGEVWDLGGHRLMCGDCRNGDDVARLLDGVPVNLAFTSPPYADRRTYDEMTDFQPIPPDDYVEWFAPVAAHVADHLAVDGSWFVNIKPGAEGLDRELYVFDLVIAHVRSWGWHFGDELCWRRVGVPGRFTRRFKNQFEPVYQFARGDWKFRPDEVMHYSDSVVSGPGGSPATNEHQGRGSFDFGSASPGLAYPGTLLPTFSGSHEATGHSAAFPVGLPGWFVQAYTDEGDSVYDPFIGSGSTLMAAHDHGRVGYGMEISPGYCDIVIDRFARHYDIEARRC